MRDRAIGNGVGWYAIAEQGGKRRNGWRVFVDHQRGDAEVFRQLASKCRIISGQASRKVVIIHEQAAAADMPTFGSFQICLASSMRRASAKNFGGEQRLWRLMLGLDGSRSSCFLSRTMGQRSRQ